MVPGIENRPHVRRDGTITWTFRVRWIDPVTGQRVGEEFDDQDEAIDFRARRRLAKRSGRVENVDAGRDTLAEFEGEWWEVYALVELEDGTQPSYRRILDKHVLPRIGHNELRQIDAELVLRWRAAMQKDGVGAPTVRKAMAILQSMLRCAVEWSRIPGNPAREVRKPPRTRKAVRPLPPLEVEQIRHRLPTERDRLLVSLLAYAGLRPEEALALLWAHVLERTLLIEQKNVDGEILTGQKTKRPPRSIGLLSPLAEDLAAYRPADAHPDDLVIAGEHGLPWTASDYGAWRRDVFAPVADELRGRPTSAQLRAARAHARRHRDDEQAQQKALELAARRKATKGVRPYDLRHSFASLLIHEGRLSVAEIAEQMGHSIQTLLSTYAHVIAELRDAPKVPASEQIQVARDQIGRSR